VGGSRCRAQTAAAPVGPARRGTVAWPCSVRRVTRPGIAGSLGLFVPSPFALPAPCPTTRSTRSSGDQPGSVEVMVDTGGERHRSACKAEPRT
jgi:hypothetical protein